jgi:hypothetical protein
VQAAAWKPVPQETVAWQAARVEYAGGQAAKELCAKKEKAIIKISKEKIK